MLLISRGWHYLSVSFTSDDIDEFFKSAFPGRYRGISLHTAPKPGGVLLLLMSGRSFDADLRFPFTLSLMHCRPSLLHHAHATKYRKVTTTSIFIGAASHHAMMMPLILLARYRYICLFRRTAYLID